jgi:hypothetical protein
VREDGRKGGRKEREGRKVGKGRKEKVKKEGSEERKAGVR